MTKRGKSYYAKKKKKSSKWSWKKIKTRWRKFRLALYQKLGKGTVMGIGLMLVLFLTYQVIQDRSGQPDNNTQIQHVSRESFVQKLVPTAQRLQKEYGVLASVSLAQAMVESDFGQSQLAANYYNLFGVKAAADDPNGVDLETKEYVNNEWVTIVDRFKVYKSWEDSLVKHAELIFYGTSWNAKQYQAVFEAKDYQSQARGLQSSGYATDPDYADKLIAMIEEWQLTQYDQ